MGFSEDFSQAMQGVTQGVNNTVQKRQAMEDADKQRAALEVQRAEAERKANFAADTEQLQKDILIADAELARVEAAKATGTVDSDIDTTLLSNEAAQAQAEASTQTDLARVAGNAGQDIADTEKSARDVQNKKNEYIKAQIKEKVAAGVPHAQAVQESSDAWTKVKGNELARDDYETAIDQAATDRLNGIPAQKAITRKIKAGAERRSAEMIAERVRLEQKGEFVKEQFALDQADNFMEQARASIHLAAAGDTKGALNLIDLDDADGNGVGDIRQAGGVDTKLITRADGTTALVAVDKNNRPVKDEDGQPVIIDEGAVSNYFDDKARGGKVEVPKTAASAAAAARILAGKTPKPMSSKDFTQVQDVVDDFMGTKWGMGTVGADGKVDNFNLDIENVLPTKDLDGPIYERATETTLDEDGRAVVQKGKKVVKEPSGEAFYSATIDQMEIDMTSKLAGAQQSGSLETVAPQYGTIPSTVKSVYGHGFFPETYQAALARGAQRAAVDAQLTGESRETFMQSLMNSFGDKDKYNAMPEDIKKFVNAEVLKLAAKVQASDARDAREDDPTIAPETK